MRNYIEFKNDYLEVKEVIKKYPNHLILRAKCLSCGRLFTIRSNNLNRQKSCGCMLKILIAKSRTTHGLTLSTTYQSWRCMLKRCYLQSDSSYDRYGKIGVTVCEEWRNSFESFLKEVGIKPNKDYTIDRFPNRNGNYEPGNVRWATKKEQQNNRDCVTQVTINGETMCIFGWCKKLGLRQSSVWGRINKNKMTPEEALTKPFRKWKKKI